ncbi:MAG: hypothetical protein HXS54_06470 [Theionarchaea archaeon]|nr:hypothetical protein [Theionarchaea archaeon]
MVTGEIIEWNDDMITNPDSIRNKIVYNKGHIPLYRAAFLADHHVRAVLMEEGGKNYHPLILLNDAGIPAVAGIGPLDLEGIVTVGKGMVYKGEISPEEPFKPNDTHIPDTSLKVYANIGYYTAIKKAAQAKADGIGILRTEFTLVRTLSRLLSKKFEGKPIKEILDTSNEADLIYAMATHKKFRTYLKNDLKQVIMEAVNYFGEKDIIVRTLDIPRRIDEPMGNRGIRRCISEGGHTITLMGEAIKEVLQEKDCHIGVILPLVSHYSQIKESIDVILDTGLHLHESFRIKFGWEIEQPAASQNNEVWLTAFTKEYKCPPHFIGIGTNDLTQFTMALGRDVYTQEKNEKAKTYLKTLYNEGDFSVIKQIYEVSKQCKKFRTQLLLLGQAASNPEYAELMFSFGITPSVVVDSISRVKKIAYEFEKKNPRNVIKNYIETVCKNYPLEVQSSVRDYLFQVFDVDM